MMTNRLQHCDCVEGMNRLPDNFIDLTVTSPPYDDLRTYAPLPMPKFQQVAEELLRITKPGGVVVWVVQEQIRDGSQTGTSSEQRLYFRDIGFRLHDRLIMARYGLRVPAPHRYGLPVEEAFVLSKGAPAAVTLWKDKPNKHAGKLKTSHRRLRNGEFEERMQSWVLPRYGRRSNIWRYATGKFVAKESWVRRAAHGAVMPEKMAEDLILSYSKPDALVFDPFCGLATTCKMALLNHRRYLGMEISAEFHRLAVKRMTQAHTEYIVRLHTLLLGA